MTDPSALVPNPFGALGALWSVETRTPVPPPVCTGSGTRGVDFTPAAIPSTGLCGICGQRVPIYAHDFTLTPHAYRDKA